MVRTAGSSSGCSASGAAAVAAGRRTLTSAAWAPSWLDQLRGSVSAVPSRASASAPASTAPSGGPVRVPISNE